MKYVFIVILQILFVSNMFSLEIDTIRLQLAHSECYPNNIIEDSVLTNSNGLLIYPNPSHGEFKIAFDDFDIHKTINLYIYNIQGSIVYLVSIKLQTNIYSLNLSFLKPGLYFISAHQKDDVNVSKIVIY